MNSIKDDLSDSDSSSKFSLRVESIEANETHEVHVFFQILMLYDFSYSVKYKFLDTDTVH